MFSQKVAQQSLRRLAVQQPYAAQWSMMKTASPAAVAMGKNIQTRSVQSTTDPDPTKILAKQRLNRPVSPHLSIYRPQITWIGSSSHRITGILLSGSLYLYSTAYLASPLMGWDIGSASLVAAFGALPIAAKVALKGTMAFPFVYHTLNGIRHLVWDTCSGITNQQVIKSGWTVVGLTTVSAIILACL
ncbi:hypothetical protein ASPWEDRAFT_101403 [Aspergillus wentii DTO 134E9]|uniref:Cytochrome b560 subunit of succinate dehydrogenase n=1 Tax=Aspergillus wentii DTO 134E9 TaxID=1073089 RepID=A0A1L9S3K1_ASPWE|nr:uncharacterized protein ASPWEDRAFT_101403 [Aspergillus wentii DTO 134E9]KAI9930088.1 hypothetical protein MW887_011898 [Aspergillus wentii]OJJ41751.1 hypothetical protein ASPWEDRAFT_101403 [Aspergillus wentii DTO 134E9]